MAFYSGGSFQVAGPRRADRVEDRGRVRSLGDGLTQQANAGRSSGVPDCAPAGYTILGTAMVERTHECP
jgi:hypothetical protein